MKGYQKVRVFFTAMFLLAGCSGDAFKFEVSGGKIAEKPLPTSGSLKNVAFAEVYEKVFRPRCTSCHGLAGGASLESYDKALKTVPGLRLALFEKHTMPKGGPLDQNQLDLVATWINEGAKEGPAMSALSPLEPKFDSIKDNIFSIRCVGCHASYGEGKNVLFDTKAELLDSPLDLVVPDDPDSSGLLLALRRNDNKKMPPIKMHEALKDSEIAVIRAWIAHGAKD